MSISFNFNPAFFKARLDASTGPIPIILGSTPITAELTIFAMGLRLFSVTPFSEANNIAAAPSFKPDAFPAVTVPPSFLKAVLSFDKISIDVFPLINSSCSNKMGSFFFCGIEIGIISSENLPDF